jgi:hypothetical protein
MITTPIKELAAAREKLAQPERTIANELPQELSKLPEQDGFSDVNSFLKGPRQRPIAAAGKKPGARRKR